MSDGAMIELQSASKRYSRGVPALNEVSLTIRRGEMVFLAGPSGAGKSTLLKLIAAIEQPTNGAVLVNGQDIGRIKRKSLPYFRRNLGLILQEQRLLADRSVLANVMLPLMVCGAGRSEAEQRARAALDRVGLLDKVSNAPLSLSGGEQQRVAIARAIVNRPQIILADEPSANLDRVSAGKVFDALRSFHAAGVTCVISTHDESLLANAGRIVYLNSGQLERDAPAQPAKGAR
jgi:cell division transport system ATP-binding protein